MTLHGGTKGKTRARRKKLVYLRKKFCPQWSFEITISLDYSGEQSQSVRGGERGKDRKRRKGNGYLLRYEIHAYKRSKPMKDSLVSCQ